MTGILITRVVEVDGVQFVNLSGKARTVSERMARNY